MYAAKIVKWELMTERQKKNGKRCNTAFFKKNFGTRIVMGLLNLDHNQKKKKKLREIFFDLAL